MHITESARESIESDMIATALESVSFGLPNMSRASQRHLLGYRIGNPLAFTTFVSLARHAVQCFERSAKMNDRFNVNRSELESIASNAMNALAMGDWARASTLANDANWKEKELQDDRELRDILKANAKQCLTHMIALENYPSDAKTIMNAAWFRAELEGLGEKLIRFLNRPDFDVEGNPTAWDRGTGTLLATVEDFFSMM